MAIPVSIRVYHDTGDVSSDSAAAQAGCTAACTSYYTGTEDIRGFWIHQQERHTNRAFTLYQLTATAAPGWYLKGWDVVYKHYVTGGVNPESSDPDDIRTDVEETIERRFVSGPSPYPPNTSGTSTSYYPLEYEDDNRQYTWIRHTFKLEIVAVYAQFAQGDAPTPDPSAYYKVTTNSNPSTFGTTDGDGDYARDSNCTITATPATHSNPYARYEFDYWEINGARVQGAGATYTFTVTAHMTCVAHFVEKWKVWAFRFPRDSSSIWIKLDGERDDGGSTPEVGKWLPAGQSFTLEAHAGFSSDWDFVGWYRLDQSDPLTGGTLVTTNYRHVATVSAGYNAYRADWFDTRVLITVSTVGGASSAVVSINGQSDQSHPWTYSLSVSNNRTATLGATLSGGYYNRFLYWTDTNSGSGSHDEHDNILSRSANYSVSLPGSSAAGTSRYYYAVYGDCTNIKSNVSPDGGGSITYSRDPDSPADSAGDHWYLNGTSVSLTATPSSGYTFAFWAWTEYGKTKKSYNATYSFNSVDGVEWELTAYFKSSNECIIEVESDGKCTVSGDGIYTIGTSCTITASFDTRYYEFDHWEKDGASVSTSASYTFTVTEDATFTAYVKYREFTVAVSADPSEGGTATGGGTYHYADSIALRASPSTGYRFDGWYKDGQLVSTVPVHGLTVAQDETYVARFSKQTFTISVSVSDGGGSVTGGGVYEYGDTCTLTATAESLNTFVRWNDDDTSATKTFTVTQNESFIAYFASGLRITTVASPEEGGTTTGDGIYEYSDRVRLEATPSKGYELDHWEKDGDVVGYSVWLTFTFKWSDAGVYTAVFSLVSKGELIYDEATGRLICSNSGQLIYHDKMTPSH